jgi:alpha-amylase
LFWRSRGLFQEANLIGWVRHGDAEHPTKAAIVLSNKEGGSIRMFIGEDYAGKIFIDQTEGEENHVTIQNDGFGEFSTPSAGLSVWISEEDV